MRRCQLLSKIFIRYLMDTLLASCGTAKDKTENKNNVRYQYGIKAEEPAQRILGEGVLPMELNVGGEPAIPIKCAEALGLDVSAKTLLSLTVYNSYLWEE